MINYVEFDFFTFFLLYFFTSSPNLAAESLVQDKDVIMEYEAISGENLTLNPLRKKI